MSCKCLNIPHVWAWMAVCLVAAGCHPTREFFPMNDYAVVDYKRHATEIEYPDAHHPQLHDAVDTLAPRTIREPGEEEYWDLSLEEAIQVGLANSKVFRDLGGRVISVPQGVNTVYEPAIQESDPRFGTEAALSAFDAQLSSSVFWERNDRPVNQVVPGFSLPVFEQDLGTFQLELAKTNATGGTWAVRNNTRYEWNNNPNNRFPSVWETDVEAEFRQPLLQGAGIEFNRIAGPAATPGFFFSNGVMIARVNNDISLADFEAGVIRLISDLENAYWDLYFAYRDLDAKIAARDSALRTWRRVYALQKSGSPGGEAENEAQAREQYYLFRNQVEDALSGTPGGSSQSGSGSGAGTFRSAGGVYAREANLRFLLGLAANDGRLIRPINEPSHARVAFDWHSILSEALCRRVELRRQRWLVKRRELELTATKNFLLPRLDAIGRYRYRGLGDDLLEYEENNAPFGDAVSNLLTGDFQEWQLGLQFSLPLGFRQAMTAVRNAELNLTREKALLQEQELSVSHDLGSAIRELERAYQAIETNFNRRVAAQRQLEATEAARDAGRIGLDVVLDSQRRLADAETAYFRSMIEYNLAIKSVHFEKGSLLDYNNVSLSEGPWPNKAYFDAQRRAHRRLAAQEIDYGFTKPQVISAGSYRQQTEMVEGEVIHEGMMVAPGEVLYEGEPEAILESANHHPPEGTEMRISAVQTLPDHSGATTVEALESTQVVEFIPPPSSRRSSPAIESVAEPELTSFPIEVPPTSGPVLPELTFPTQEHHDQAKSTRQTHESASGWQRVQR